MAPITNEESALDLRYDQSAAGRREDMTFHVDTASSHSLPWKVRIRYFTWTFFTFGMATGGIANVLHSMPLRFTGLYAIGVIFLICNLVIFVVNCTCMALRAYYWPGAFKDSFLHPTESLFVPASVVHLALVLINITEYGLVVGKTGPWLLKTMVILYWIYVALAVLFTTGIYLLMWSTQTFTISQMTPVWVFPSYPLLLVGPFAANLTYQSTGAMGNHALQIIIGAVIVQGIGFMMSLTVYSAYLYRLMTQKLPAERLRPGMFISVGPSGFTVSGLINIGQNIPHVVGPDFMGNGELAGQVIKIISVMAGIWLWGLALFFFLISVGAHWSCFKQTSSFKFAMSFWAFIFPNTSLATATFALAKGLDSNLELQIVGCVIAAALVFGWSFILGLNIRAIIVKQILWPPREEESHEHLWKKDIRPRFMPRKPTMDRVLPLN